MDKAEILTNVGILVAGVFAGLIAYFGKKPPATTHTDTVVAGVGLELGNRLQADQVIAELKRIGDYLAVLADRRQATTEAKLDRILQELDEAEERHQPPRRVRRSTRSRKPQS